VSERRYSVGTVVPASLSRKATEVLSAMAAGAVLWRGVTGCRVEGYGDVDWETFYELFDARLIEWQEGKLVGPLSMPFVITAAGREAMVDGAPDS